MLLTFSRSRNGQDEAEEEQKARLAKQGQQLQDGEPGQNTFHRKRDKALSTARRTGVQRKHSS